MIDTKAVLLLLVLAIGCKNTVREHIDEKDTAVLLESDHPSFVTNIERAHGKARLFENEVLCFNLELAFGAQKSLMKIITTPSSSAIRVDKNNGTSTIMVDGEIYTNADKKDWNRERFGIYTYQYFFMAPYKFSDSGTVWAKLEPMEIEGEVLDRAMLTFEAGTGDAPDDWYIVHSDPESHLVQHIGYIVTGGGVSREEAEKNAHAISYDGYKTFAGVPVSTEWRFSEYDKASGLGSIVGTGTIRNVEMMDLTDQFAAAFTDGYSRIPRGDE